MCIKFVGLISGHLVGQGFPGALFGAPVLRMLTIGLPLKRSEAKGSPNLSFGLFDPQGGPSPKNATIRQKMSSFVATSVEKNTERRIVPYSRICSTKARPHHPRKGSIQMSPVNQFINAVWASQGSLWHRNRVKSGNRCRIDVE